MKVKALLAIFISIFFTVSTRSAETVNIGPIDKTQAGFFKQAKANQQATLTGWVTTIPMGGAVIVLESIEKGQVILFRPTEISMELLSSIENLVEKKQPVAVTGMLSLGCSAQQQQGGVVGCYRFDTSKKISIAPSKPNDAEKTLIEALRLKNADASSLAKTRTAIAAYVRAGFIPANPTTRGDYVDTYIVSKPMLFLGSKMVILKNEYMSAYLGCCVNPGIEVIFVNSQGDPNTLRDFAQVNSCVFSDDVDIKKILKTMGFADGSVRGRYSSISCRKDQ